MEDISWKLIDIYFKDNPNNLVQHHLESYNYFFQHGIKNIIRENNPIRFIERDNSVSASATSSDNETRNELLLYLGGKSGNKIYFGKPIIYDDNNVHFMYPNDARLRNMTYGITIHYDVDVDVISYEQSINTQSKTETMEKKTTSITLEKIYLGKFPIMLQSDLCILKSLSPEVRFNMGECRNDFGGYFIIDGKEKVIIPQEKFADNMIYIRQNKADDLYSHSAEIRTVSEDASKPIRTMAVKIVAPTTVLSNNQIVVLVPNVKKPVPLFILMRALGVVSDKDIIETCLLDMKKYESYIDLFIPSIHDAGKIFNQQTALEYIATFTKRRSINGVLEILINYFLPNVGETNFLDKAYFLGNMVKRLLAVYSKEDKPTDRDNFQFKRVETTGVLLYDLFREYFLVQKRAISLAIDSEYYYHSGKYRDNFMGLIELNYREFFKDRSVESGFKKAFKGKWGSLEYTKKVGIVQDLNRLSWYTFISSLRKLNLPLDSSAKVVGPRLLNTSQWGFIDPVDTPDGGNIGLHKHLALSTYISIGYSSIPLIKWLRANIAIKLLQECNVQYLADNTKLFVNGSWIGVVEDPIEVVKLLKLYRRNGIIPTFTSIRFEYSKNEIYIFTDSGRLTRPIYYIDEDEKHNKKISYKREHIVKLLNEEKVTWNKIVAGFGEKKESDFNFKKNKIYNLNELYDVGADTNTNGMLYKNQSLIDYVDTSEEETMLIATKEEQLTANSYYTNIEIDSSLILGVMGNLIIYPENNPYPRDAFSCGQSKQAVSVYHSNYQMRIDKMGVVLNYGQVPLVKSRYLEYINNESQPYGVNAIVAIMSYTGYNVEDAILINEGAIKRGLFNTTYYSMYEASEESTKVSGSMVNSYFTEIANKNVIGIKPGYDYSYLDKTGLVKENTPINDKIVLIGKVIAGNGVTTAQTQPQYNYGDGEDEIQIQAQYQDSSVTTKKGQLGFVDKSFITEGEEGFRLAKIRIREERIPAIGDKMASRSGQKGTIGLIIPEEDMPFTADGIRPDLIINPHAIPSRMTIGQLIESLLGKGCALYGGYGDCTAFKTKGPNTKLYGTMLVNAGYHASGNQLLYNGMTGEQLQADIYIGPTYYMRLKHMVKDKINYRARGPRTLLTRQTVQGRANDGGLRIGEMERDSVIAHGASHFLQESFLVRGDEYFMAVCNKTGAISIYNKNKNLFLSPFADGPIHYYNTVDGKMNISNVSKFGRSFSILRIPYALKLLIQELQTMNIQMRIITDDNVDQLMSMSYSKNIMELTKNVDVLKNLIHGDAYKIEKETEKESDKETEKETNKLNDFIKNYINYMNTKIRNNENKLYNKEQAELKNLNEEESSSFEVVYPETPETESSINDENMENQENQEMAGPTTPDEAPPTSIGPRTPSDSPPTTPPLQTPTNEPEIDFGTKEYNDFYQSLPMKSKKMILDLPPRDRLLILKKTKLLKERKMMEEAQQQEQQSEQQLENPEPEKKNPLEYSEDKPEEIGAESISSDTINDNSSTKNINLEIKVDSNNDTSSSSNTGVKKIVF
uniref:DNA-directed RNA polymerase n=1 Tax=viral metagenome TaxID=1070528 RepID=A0A6C0EFM7_9ZZZZ